MQEELQGLHICNTRSGWNANTWTHERMKNNTRGEAGWQELGAREAAVVRGQRSASPQAGP